jgi:hypothetical protein
VVLRGDDELRAVGRVRLESVFAAAVGRVLADVQIAGLQHVREVAHFRWKAFVVAVLLAGEQGVQ